MGEEISHSIHSNPSSFLMQRLRSSFGVSATEFQDVLEVISEKKRGLAKEITTHETDIQKHQIKIHREKEEINRHRATLVGLRNKQKGLEQCLQLSQSLLSPIRRLPAEILREIFIHFCDRISLSTYEISCPALILAAVCSSWRRLALSTSRLWTRIYITVSRLDSAPLARLKRFIPLVNLALENSRNAPLHLDLAINVEAKAGSAQNDAMGSILKSIARHSHHWYHAELMLPGIFLCEMDPFVQSLPSLESLTVVDFELPFDIATTAPKLCHLVLLCDISPNFIPRLPWDQILTLRLTTKSISQLSVCLQSCTALQQFHVDYSDGYNGDWDEEARNEAHMIHDRIQSLSLSNLWYTTDVERVFTSFTFPQMTQISLVSESRDSACGWTWTDALTRTSKGFFTRASCAIVSLKLKWIPIPDKTLITLLRLLPSIENLSVVQLTDFKKEGSKKRVCNITDLLITSLRVSHSRSVTKALAHPLLPKLQRIELAIDLHYKPSCDALVELVESRWIPDPVYASEVGVNCLRSVAFHFLNATPSVYNHDFRPLVSLRDAGMNFVVTYTEDDEPAEM